MSVDEQVEGFEEGLKKEEEIDEEECPRCDTKLEQQKDGLWLCSKCEIKWTIEGNVKGLIEEKKSKIVIIDDTKKEV